MFNFGSLTDVTFNWPSLNEILTVLTLQAGFNTSLVVISTTLLGSAAGMVGAFALLRKRSLIGDALAHSTLPGLVTAFIVAFWLGLDPRNIVWLLAGATLSGILAVWTVQWLANNTRLSEDSAIGIVLSVFFGAGIVLLSIVQNMQTGSAGGLNHFIYGQTAAMRTYDAYLMAGSAMLVFISASLLFKELALVCFDRDFANVQGWSVNLIDFILLALITTITVIGLQAVGIILIVALLIIPSAAARFWTENLKTLLILSTIIGGLSGYLGSTLSALLPRLPAGAVIVVVAGIFFLFSFCLAPTRGAIFASYRLVRLRLRVAKDHILRDIFERMELENSLNDRDFTWQTIPSLRSRTKLFRTIILFFLECLGHLKVTKTNMTLTTKGFEAASRLTRNHRLWEEYLVEYAGLLPSHVDYSADYVEHILSPDLVLKLEQRLAARNIQPNDIPSSIHPLPHSVKNYRDKNER